MKRFRYPYLLAAFATLFLISCESKELVAKRDQQVAEIARLKGELALLDEKLKNAPPDQSEQLLEAKKKSEEQVSEIARLETEIAELSEKKQVLQSEFKEYQSKYTIR